MFTMRQDTRELGYTTLVNVLEMESDLLKVRHSYSQHTPVPDVYH